MSGARLSDYAKAAREYVEDVYPSRRFNLRGVHALEDSVDVLLFDPDLDAFLAVVMECVASGGPRTSPVLAVVGEIPYAQYINRGGTLALPIDCYKVVARATSYVLIERCSGASTYRDGDDERALSAWTSREAARSALSAWEQEHVGLSPVEHRAVAAGATNAGLDDKRCNYCETEARIFTVEVLDGVPS